MRADSRQAGVTLAEALIVVALMALIVAIAVVQINKSWQKSRLESAAGDITSFLQSAYTYAMANRAPVFVRFESDPLNPSVVALRITQNIDGSGREFKKYDVPGFVGPAATPTWPSPASGVWYLECDTNGRTFDPGTGTPVAGSQVLAITHTSMISGWLTPKIVYTIQVFPLWQVTAIKSIS